MARGERQKRAADAPPREEAVCRAIRGALGDWYALNRRDLPWRRTGDPYRIWVSEVMLQQTQVDTMLPYYRRFIRRFPDVHRLALADRQTVLKYWEGLGYYSRARNLHRAASMVVDDFGGRFPDAWEGWMQLPGVGEYIASAVSSIVYGLCHAVVDGNVKRVLARLSCLDHPANRSAAKKAYQRLADRLLDRSRPGDHNQAVMELGALVCKPRRPLCSECPVRNFCCALKSGGVDRYPRRVERPRLPERHLAAGVVMKKGKILVVRRPDDGLLGGLWEFPSGEIPDGGDPAEACARGMLDAVNLSVTVENRLTVVRHTYTHFKLRLEVFACRWRSGRVRRRQYPAHKWIALSAVGTLPLHKATLKVLAAIDDGASRDL
jgi:A/G-specific adenine glycosylase